MRRGIGGSKVVSEACLCVECGYSENGVWCLYRVTVLCSESE